MAPPNITIKEVDQPTEANIAEATQLFCDFMSDDPFWVALVGAQMEFLPVLVNSLIAEIAFKLGDFYGAFNEEGTLVGFQAWTPPGKIQFAASEEDKAQLEELAQALPTEEFKQHVTETIGIEFPRLVNTLSIIPDCELVTYWCNFNFVDAKYHRQGISKALLDLAVSKAKNNGWKTMALATTNSRNLPIYEHLGFVNEGYKLMRTPIKPCPLWIFVRSLEVPLVSR